ncbi:retrieval of early ER protein Rer1 [Kockovaella imperatae]|uniref:Protein RER1 n=1 Tax=Kockovaella imperatae TaxID=4999 RepID=A0A1Y1UF31_9TREE|nr:retrieval of early ER protein Rer1 [Kockovaella imperatae]ORX36599.1 retrieval of early ER protein Rer1 [Kockovaella imperatae]
MGGGRGGMPAEKNVAEMVKENTNIYARKFQMLLDRSTPHVMERWLVTLGLFLLFSLNVILRQGWYIVCYALAIYILNLFLAFLQPRFDPSLADDLAAEDVEEGAPGLPGGGSKSPGGLKGLFSGGGDDEEFRPFIRRLPEFKFWYSATKATAIALTCTITRATDVPVYWPILLVYFLTLFALTMRRQIQHMIKYRYIPFDLGKKKGYGKK